MRCHAVLVSLLATSACAFDGSNQVSSSGDAGEPDAGETMGVDAGEEPNAADANLGCQNFASLFNACAVDPTSGDIALTEGGTYEYDTDDGSLVSPGGVTLDHVSRVVPAAEGDVRILVAESFTLGSASALRVEGGLPFGIAAFQTLSVEGIIDVGRGGAGSQSDCGDGSGENGQDRNGGGGGGGGGGFQGGGGGGGAGDGDSSNQGAPGAGGIAQLLPASPRGGCPGGSGGRGEDPGGSGGSGGGALYLSSGVQVVISGGVQAGGSGGQGGRETGAGFADGGGGGGGSGGFVFLEAPTVLVSGAIAANGGGGGEGSGDGDRGNDGAPGSLNAIPAAGGAGGSPSGDQGAQGSAGMDLVGPSVQTSDDGGGGGGGGAAGFVVIDAASTALSGTLSPPAI